MYAVWCVVCMGVRYEVVLCMSGEGADGFCSVSWSACMMSPLEQGTGQSALRKLSLSALWELNQSVADTCGTDHSI